MFKNTVSNITIAEDGSPYRGYATLPENTPKGTRYKYRAALIQYASGVILENAPLWQHKLLKDKDCSEAITILATRDIAIENSMPILLSECDILELAESVQFILANPPHIGVFSNLKQKMTSSQKRVKSLPTKSKRKVLNTLTRHEKAGKIKHWRDAIFDFAMSIQDTPTNVAVNTNKRLTVATLALTGARPAEFVGGIDAHLLPPTDEDEEGRILFRILGSKVSSSDVDTYVDTSVLSEKDKDLLDALGIDAATKNRETRGQEYRYLEIGIQTAAARYIKDFIVNNKKDYDFTLLSEKEQISIINYDYDEVIASATLAPVGATFEGNINSKEDIHRRTSTLNKMFVRMTKKVFNTKSNVSLYTFRHAFASDIKAEFAGSSSKGVTAGYKHKGAVSLGHISTSTTQKYGNRKAGKKGRSTHIRAAIASREVRNPVRDNVIVGVNHKEIKANRFGY